MQSRNKAKPKKYIKNTTTSDIDLINYMDDVDGFKGVISYDKFKCNILKNGDSIILNLDRGYKNNGTHWVAMIKLDNKYYYKDSFGGPPPNEIIDECGNVFYGTNINQKLDAEDCGKRSANWIRNMKTYGIRYFYNSERK